MSHPLIQAPDPQLVFSRQPTLDEVAKSGLLDDIRRRGILSPPILRELADRPGYWEILAGNARCFCSRVLNRPSVTAVNLGPISRAEGLEVIVRDHQLRRTMRKDELLRYVIAARKETDLTLAEIGARFGLRATQVSRLFTITNLDPALLDRVLAGDLDPSHAYHVATVRDRARQAALFQEAVEKGLTRDEVARRAGALKGGRAAAAPVAVRVGTAFDATREGLDKVKEFGRALAAEVDRLVKLQLEPDVIAGMLRKQWGVK